MSEVGDQTFRAAVGVNGSGGKGVIGRQQPGNLHGGYIANQRCLHRVGLLALCIRQVGPGVNPIAADVGVGGRNPSQLDDLSIREGRQCDLRTRQQTASEQKDGFEGVHWFEI